MLRFNIGDLVFPNPRYDSIWNMGIGLIVKTMKDVPSQSIPGHFYDQEIEGYKVYWHNKRSTTIVLDQDLMSPQEYCSRRKIK